MSNKNAPIRSWKFQGRHPGIRERVAVLEASWEVHSDPVSDDYTPQEISAEALLLKWLEIVQNKHPDELIPIYWSVQCASQGIFETMPFQYPRWQSNDEPLNQSFLDFFTHPEDPETGELLNWLSLPVKDKFWNAKRADKGGFIQQATGWKPSILQPFVYLPALINHLR